MKQQKLTLAILKHIESLGHTVSIHRVNGAIEMHAVKLDGSEDEQIVRFADGDGQAEDYQCACLLARVLGINIENG
jgi:hypothetical protein